MTSRDAALDYIRLGLSVFPLRPQSKTPAVPWQHYQERRMDASEAKRLWTQLPDAGVAIVTGAISGIVVIDVDPRNGGTLIDDEVPGCIVAATGGGGWHYLCRYPGGRVPCGKTARPGIDRKGDGGYIVAPPSIHPSGNPYEWLRSPAEAELGTAPAWVFQNPERSADGGTPEEPRGPWVAETLLHPERCAPGSQEETLRNLAWWAAKHLPARDIAFATLMQWASRLPLGKPHDPWTEEHVTDRLDRAYEKRALEPGAAAGIVDDRPAVKVPSRLREHVRKAKEYIAMQTERDDWIVNDFVAPGAFTEIIGVMKEGKSTLVGGMLRSLLAGQPFLDRPTRKSRVLWITEQVGKSFQATLERAQLQQSEDCLVLTLADTYGLPWEQAAAECVEIAKEQECRLIVVDTLARLAGITEEDEAKSVTVLNPFLAARASGIAVVFVRHGRKAGGAINVAARGSGAITGEMDVCLLIRAPMGVTSDYRYLEGVSRLGDTIEEHLRYEGGSYVKGDPPRSHQQAQKDEKLERLRAALEPVKAKTKADLRKETGLPDTTLARYLDDLERQGVIVTTPAGFVLAAVSVQP